MNPIRSPGRRGMASCRRALYSTRKTTARRRSLGMTSQFPVVRRWRIMRTMEVSLDCSLDKKKRIEDSFRR